MESKQIVHVIGEAVIIGGVVYHFNKQISDIHLKMENMKRHIAYQNNCINELKQIVIGHTPSTGHSHVNRLSGNFINAPVDLISRVGRDAQGTMNDVSDQKIGNGTATIDEEYTESGSDLDNDISSELKELDEPIADDERGVEFIDSSYLTSKNKDVKDVVGSKTEIQVLEVDTQ